MIEDALSDYRDALVGLGLEVPPPPSAPTPDLFAKLAVWHGYDVPAEVIALHALLGPDCPYPDSWLVPIPTTADEALDHSAWIGVTQVPALAHIPTFTQERAMLTVALNELNRGEVWYCSIDGEPTGNVRVALSLEQLFRDWVALIEAKLLIPGQHGNLTIEQDVIDRPELFAHHWPVLNTVALPFPIWDDTFRQKRQRDSGVDPETHIGTLVFAAEDEVRDHLAALKAAGNG